MEIIGIDLARPRTDITVIRNVKAPKDIKIGDEFYLPMFHKSQIGLKEENRLYVFNKYRIDGEEYVSLRVE